MKSLTLSDEEVTKLGHKILETDVRRVQTKSEHELLRVSDGQIQFILYKSGKLVHNSSSATRQFLMQILSVEKRFDLIVGSDETGKGEWYGPLVVVAVGLRPSDSLKLRLLGAQDSKRMALSSMSEVETFVRRLGSPFSNFFIGPQAYNMRMAQLQREGQTLNDLLAWAHTRAIEAVLKKTEFTNAQVVIDKFDIKATEFRLGKVRRFKVGVIQKSKGETEIPVAVASILAKLLFEEQVDKLDQEFGLDLRHCKPIDVPPTTLPLVAKLHFKNVQEAMETKS